MKYMRWFHNTSASTLVPTQQQKQMLEHKGFTNTEVVSRGIDGELFSPTKRNQQLRDQWGASENEPVFLYVGRIAAEKNLELLADTYESISEKYPKAKFVLVGDGPLKPSLAARYPALIFAGVKRGEKLAQHYASGDIFLFPSQTDTFGNVVTEAMASGCCICAFDDAAAKEHLDNRQSAFLADLGDDRQFIKNAIAAYEK
ncbi:glycosyltransferase, partial [Oleiphilus sp. HI0066]|uniref:glycosyltransferase n=3 Tax=Oleiphilus TaxID=141450 RepID=UPI000A9AF6E2